MTLQQAARLQGHIEEYFIGATEDLEPSKDYPLFGNIQALVKDIELYLESVDPALQYTREDLLWVLLQWHVDAVAQVTS
jgi:hypothetical protein